MTRLPHVDLESRRRRLSLLSGLVLLWALLAISQAQITLDGSLGPPGPLAGPHARIGAELGQIRGGNLFHSFGAFNVPTGGSATFTGPPAIANIVGRVTGGQPSAVDGLLRSTVAGVNLFLLNPSGVLFGPNAALDVRGSFHVSTADYLRFADGAQFFTNLGQASVLTVAPPSAFGFLGSTPAVITMQASRLEVPTGRALSVVGGDIVLEGRSPIPPFLLVGTLAAPSGRIQLASVASAGEVLFSPLELAPDLQMAGFARLGQVTLSQGALLDASGNGGGTVLLRSGRLRIDRSAIFADNTGDVDGTGLGVDLRVATDAVIANRSFLSTDSLGAGRARDLRLTAGTLRIDDSFLGSIAPRLGTSGNIVVQAAALTLTGGSQVASMTSGAGRGGEVTVAATDTIAIGGRSGQGVQSGLFSIAAGRGDAGRLSISAPTVRLEGGVISTRSQGEGQAGDLVLTGGRLQVTGGAQLDSRTAGAGQVGNLLITATDAILLAGRDSLRGLPSGLFNVDLGGSRTAGRVVIHTPTLRMEEGALIGGAPAALDLVPEERTRGGETVTLRQGTAVGQGRAADLVVTAGTVTLTGRTAILSSTPNANPGGDITMMVDRLQLTGGARIESSNGITGVAGAGPGGRLTITATDVVALEGLGSGLFSEARGEGRGGDILLQAREIRLTDGAVISATSSGMGDAGRLTLTARESFGSDHSTVTAQAILASGGDITLHAGSRIRLIDSQLTTSVRGGPQTVGGNLTLEAPFVISDGSQIGATAVAGRGGTIGIGAEVFLADPASVVSASSELGISGTVDIRAPVTTLSGTLAPLPQAFVSAAALLPARCAARAQGGRYSSLVLGGRDGLPAEPSGVLPSPLVLEERLVADSTVTGASPRQTSARFAFLADAEKAWPRLRGDPRAGGCPP